MTESTASKDQAASPTTAELASVASYIEAMLASEHSWITNRLSWLFVSQSFCITAYVVLITTEHIRQGAEQQVTILRVGLPLLGILCSIAVGIAVRAAGRVATHLANQRASLSKQINAKIGTSIPLIGVDQSLRQADIRSTLWMGSLPQHLPWALCLLWAVLLIRVDFGV